MGVYNDMANEGGYAYGSLENQQMAEILEAQERKCIEDSMLEKRKAKPMNNKPRYTTSCGAICRDNEPITRKQVLDDLNEAAEVREELVLKTEGKVMTKINPQMYSKDGDKAVRALIEKLVKNTAELDTNAKLWAMIDSGMEEIAVVHDEVYDTEPRNCIYDIGNRIAVLHRYSF